MPKSLVALARRAIKPSNTSNKPAKAISQAPAGKVAFRNRNDREKPAKQIHQRKKTGNGNPLVNGWFGLLLLFSALLKRTISFLNRVLHYAFQELMKSLANK